MIKPLNINIRDVSGLYKWDIVSLMGSTAPPKWTSAIHTKDMT